MTTSNSSRILVDLSPHSLQLVRLENGRVVAFRECRPEAAATAAALAELGGTPAGVDAVFSPASRFLSLSGGREAASIRTARSLLAHAETVSGGLTPPLATTAVDAASGLSVGTVGSSPWILAGTTAAEVEAARARLASAGLAVGRLRLALPVRIGSVVTALQDMPETSRVLLWDLGDGDASLACVAAGGCEGATRAEAGYRQVFEAVQAGLGLKFRAAASKLFFNPGFDFTETAGPIAERVAVLLRPAIGGLGGAPTMLHVTGLPAAQAWFAKAVASALDLDVFAPDVSVFYTQQGVVDGAPPASALGLLFHASQPDGEAWRPDWLDAAAPETAPAPVAPPSEGGSGGQPAGAATSAAPAAPKQPPAQAPAAKPAPPVAPVAVAEAPEPVRKAAPAPRAAGKAAPSSPEAAPPVAEVATGAPSAPAAGTGAMPSEKPRKKNTVLVAAAVAAVVVLGGGGIWMAMSGSGGAATAVASQEMTAEERRLQEIEDARLLAEELKAPRSYRNERYNFEISDRGAISKLIGVKFTPVIDEFGWFELQGSFTGDSGRQEWFNAGGMSDRDYRVTINKAVRNGVVVFEIAGVHPRFKLDTLISCLPSSVRVRTVFTPINMNDKRGRLSGVLDMKMNRRSLVPGQRATLEANSVSYATQAGPVAVRFNSDVWGRAGEEDRQAVVAGGNLVFFYFAGEPDAKRNVLEAEIMLP